MKPIFHSMSVYIALLNDTNTQHIHSLIEMMKEIARNEKKDKNKKHLAKK